MSASIPCARYDIENKQLTPLSRDVERLPDFSLNQVGVVLQAGSQSFLLEGNPDVGLKHANRLLGPGAEVGGIGRELLLKTLNNLGVDEVENSGVASL